MTATNPMSMDNEGVGGQPYLPMAVDTTSAKDFKQADLDATLTACVIAGNNKVGMGSDGDKLFGKVVAVSAEVDDSSIPVRCTVQAPGQARGGAPSKCVAPTPVVKQMVEVDGAGAVSQASADADIAAGGHLMRGQVIAVNTTDVTVDVW